MQTEQFYYHLPAELIAQYPTKNRTDSRLLVVKSACGQFQQLKFSDLPDLLQPGDLLVVNDSRVVPARLYARKSSGGKVEIFLERRLTDGTLLVALRANKPVAIGTQLLVGDTQLEVIAKPRGFAVLRCPTTIELMQLFLEHGQIPLPPYITRPPTADDGARYQTVYATQPGAVAAPTAGLHFDRALLQQLHAAGVELARLTLHVGAGTFQPVRAANIAEHTIHRERVTVSAATCEQIHTARARGGRIIAVGTTVVRALESAGRTGELQPLHGETDLFIKPGYPFQVVDGLITNFHLPRSTLLMLVCAFAGYTRSMAAYRFAIAKHYRFYSYGDAMWALRA